VADLVTSQEAKIHLNIDGADDDARIQQLIAQVSADIEGYCRRSFTAVASVGEYHDGGVSDLILEKLPVTEITSVVDQADGSTVAPSDYKLDIDRAFVFLVDSITGATTEEPWGDGRRRWKATYKSGYAAVPADIKLAALIWIAELFVRPDGAVSERSGDYSVTVEAGIPSRVKHILDKPQYKTCAF
jgi:hypothetical protein